MTLDEKVHGLRLHVIQRAATAASRPPHPCSSPGPAGRLHAGVPHRVAHALAHLPVVRGPVELLDRCGALGPVGSCHAFSPSSARRPL